MFNINSTNRVSLLDDADYSRMHQTLDNPDSQSIANKFLNLLSNTSVENQFCLRLEKEVIYYKEIVDCFNKDDFSNISGIRLIKKINREMLKINNLMIKLKLITGESKQFNNLSMKCAVFNEILSIKLSSLTKSETSETPFISKEKKSNESLPLENFEERGRSLERREARPLPSKHK